MHLIFRRDYDDNKDHIANGIYEAEKSFGQRKICHLNRPD